MLLIIADNDRRIGPATVGWEDRTLQRAMHGDASPRKTPDAPSGSGVRRKSGVPVGSGGAVAFATLIVANVSLAFGPWFVRAADTGPVAAAFWRIALAAPMLAVLAGAGGARPQRHRQNVALRQHPLPATGLCPSAS